MVNRKLTNHITCPKCGSKIPVATSRSGRKRLNIPFRNISESLQAYHSVELASEKLGCSVGYIYQELGKKGLKPKDVIKRAEGD